MKCFRKFVFILVALLPSVAPAQIFFTPTAYSASAGASAINSGDFNNDGILDLISVNSALSASSVLSFYKGLGGGKYAAPVNTLLAEFYSHLSVGDFNRDAKLDVAAVGIRATGGGVLTLFLGSGAGTFKRGVNLAPKNPTQDVVAADFNGDHIPDLAVSLYTGVFVPGATQVYLGVGNGSFTQPPQLQFGGGQIVAGDFNADGHQDIAVLTTTDELVMFVGNGDGTFQTPLEAGNFWYPTSLAVGDFYDNRIQSLAVVTVLPSGTDYSDYVFTARYLNGSIATTYPFFIGGDLGAVPRITAGDVDGDFKDDVVVTSRQSDLNNSYLLGKGDGSFLDPAPLPVFGFEVFPMVRDLNRDSRHDIFATWFTVSHTGPYILLNTNAATNCSTPGANALSVHVCAPNDGQTLGTTATFKAAGNAFNGIAKRMELWIDGKKVGQKLEDQFKKTMTLPRGKHVASFVAVDSFDNHVGKSVTFYVQ